MDGISKNQIEKKIQNCYILIYKFMATTWLSHRDLRGQLKDEQQEENCLTTSTPFLVNNPLSFGLKIPSFAHLFISFVFFLLFF